MREYYNGKKLLKTMDIDNKKPEIFICSGNRSAGKTTYFNKLLVDKFLSGEIRKFALLYRYGYELEDCANQFFKDIGVLFYKGYTMEQKIVAKKFVELFINGKSCGYGIPLKASDNVKKRAHFFNDVDCILFDEFQSETNDYLPNEVDKLISVHTSIARGNGEHSRYVPLYMVSNTVSIVNPYFSSLGIDRRLTSDTKFLRGNGWVLENNFNPNASDSQKQSAFNRAFAKSKYVEYSTQNIYLNDNLTMIQNPVGANDYILTLKNNGKKYGLRIYKELNIVHVSHSYDNTFGTKIAVNATDIEDGYLLKSMCRLYVKQYRKIFDSGKFRFEDLDCKNALFDFLSIV